MQLLCGLPTFFIWRHFSDHEGVLTITNEKAQQFLEAIAEGLAIPETRYQQAETSYKSLGDWFHRDDSSVKEYGPAVYSQGSFRLGTAIRPLTDREEYDVDSVCELTLLRKTQYTQERLKELIGDEVKAYRKAQNMVKPVREGRRCWVLDYADGAQFHMDIVPALPNGKDVRLLLEARALDAKWASTAIGITDREEPTYQIITNDWPRSNPKGYAEWFRARMGSDLVRRKRVLAESLRSKGLQASVEDLPDYRVRTPLQASVMILKRHRDIMFANDFDLRPISVIITTLAAHAYNEQETIADALYAILSGMDKYVERVGGGYVICNPTDPLENFADKWGKQPEKAEAFFRWLGQARRDFEAVRATTDFQIMNEAVKSRMGVHFTAQAVERAASKSSTLLRTATVAPVVATPSFGSVARVPSKPKGFA